VEFAEGKRGVAKKGGAFKKQLAGSRLLPGCGWGFFREGEGVGVKGI